MSFATSYKLRLSIIKLFLFLRAWERKRQRRCGFKGTTAVLVTYILFVLFTYKVFNNKY